MKTKDLKDLRAKNIADLDKKVKEIKTELSKELVKVSESKKKNVKKAKMFKKEIAQLLTIISEKRLIGREEK